MENYYKWIHVLNEFCTNSEEIFVHFALLSRQFFKIHMTFNEK